MTGCPQDAHRGYPQMPGAMGVRGQVHPENRTSPWICLHPSPLSASPNWPSGPKFIVSLLEGRECTHPFLGGEGALSHSLPPPLQSPSAGEGTWLPQTGAASLEAEEEPS